LERWEKEPEKGDQRRGPHSVCAHALSEQEKQAIVEVSNAYSDPNRHPFRVQIGTRSDRNRHLFRRKSAHPV